MTIAADIFKKADANQNGSLTVNEVEAALTELGVLEGFSPAEVKKIVRNEFRIADSNSSGRLSLDEFTEYYVKLLKRTREEQRQDKLQQAKGIAYPPGKRALCRDLSHVRLVSSDRCTSCVRQATGATLSCARCSSRSRLSGPVTGSTARRPPS